MKSGSTLTTWGNVWIDWDGGYRKDGPRQPEQMRLLDMNDQDNSKDATLLAR